MFLLISMPDANTNSARTGSTSAEPCAVRKAPRLCAAGVFFLLKRSLSRNTTLADNLRWFWYQSCATDSYPAELRIIKLDSNAIICTHLVLSVFHRILCCFYLHAFSCSAFALHSSATCRLLFTNIYILCCLWIKPDPSRCQNCEPGTTTSVNDECFNQKLISLWILDTGLLFSLLQ